MLQCWGPRFEVEGLRDSGLGYNSGCLEVTEVQRFRVSEVQRFGGLEV